MNILNDIATRLLEAIETYRISSIVHSLLIVAIAIILAFTISRPLRTWTLARLPRDIAIPLVKLVYYSIIFVGIIMALTSLGVDVSVLLVAGGIAGIVIGLAAQTVTSNLLAGIFLYLDRPFKVGDAIAIGDTFGIVEDITIFSTRIRLFNGTVLRISNEEIFKSRIINLTAVKARRIEYQILLAHETDLNKAIEVIRRVIDRNPLILTEPAPMIFSSQVTLLGIPVNIWVWVPGTAFFEVWTTLLTQIREELLKEGIQLATYKGPIPLSIP
ncbi:MAG: mechanosensitive ion channel family protein [Acidilobaceae archaeon]